MASGAKRAGTKITDVFAPVASTASFTVSNTGTPAAHSPPLPGEVPPTTLVPYSIICFVWNSPSRPVMPCTIKRVFFPTRILIGPPKIMRNKGYAVGLALNRFLHRRFLGDGLPGSTFFRGDFVLRRRSPGLQRLDLH